MVNNRLTLLSGLKHAGLILILAEAVQRLDIVPGWHLHSHVQSNRLVGSIGEDELDVRKVFAKLQKREGLGYSSNVSRVRSMAPLQHTCSPTGALLVQRRWVCKKGMNGTGLVNGLDGKVVVPHSNKVPLVGLAILRQCHQGHA